MVYAWTMLTNNCTNIRFQSPKDFLREVDYYVEVISKYLNRPHWKKFYDTDKIQFEYTANGPSHVDGGYYNFRDPKARIFFNFSFKYDSAAIAHEITHIITPDQASLSLREGLACFIQDKFGKNVSIFNFGAPIHQMAKEFVNENQMSVIQWIGEEGIPHNLDVTGSDRIPFYILSHSFATYLIDNYGIEKYMNIYNSAEFYNSYKREYGKELSELKKQWLKFLENQNAFPYPQKDWMVKHYKEAGVEENFH